MATGQWQTITHNGQSQQVEILDETSNWAIASEPGGQQGDDTIYYLKNNKIIASDSFAVPNSGSVTKDGTVVIADWKKYGKKTRSEIHLINKEEAVHRSFEVDLSSPLVAIAPSGKNMAVSGYDQKVRIYETADFSQIGQHSVLFGDRLVPSFDDCLDRVHLRHYDSDPTLKYTISLQGSIISTSDDVDTIRYIESFDLDRSTDWTATLPELTDAYRETSNEYIRNRIANIVGDGSLAYITNPSRLRSIIDTVNDSYSCFDGDHSKLPAQILSDAHYRLAKELRKNGDFDGFTKQLDEAEQYASEVLPWYEGKKLLAKIYRLRARSYKKRNQQSSARQELEKIYALENKYEVSLATDADKNLRDELSH